MPTVTMPQLGETVTEGTVGRWLKKQGDQVEKYEPLLEVETDKVASEIPSPFAGTLAKILVEEGTTVPVGAAVCEIAEAGAKSSAATSTSAPEVAPPREMPSAEKTRASAGAAEQSGDGVRYSPAVRKLAREHNIDLNALSGTGRGGRITADDVMKFVQAGASAAPVSERPAAATSVAAVTAHPAQPHPVAIPPPAQGDTVVRVTQMRKTIADRMLLSATTVPHAWSMVEADVTELVKWREREKDAFKTREGVNLTFLPVVLLAVCGALREFPMANSTWGGDKIIQRSHINIGVAVEIEEGLVVPVVRDADRLSLSGMARSVNELVTKARNRKLTLEDMSDGTFTVDNTGALGSVASMPIINPPQAAILTLEAITKRPWVINDAIAIRSIMNLCMSIDHRVLDGSTALRLLQSVKRRLETHSA